MKRLIPALCCLFFFLSGCQTTTDPSKGGLFNYSPEAYEKRKVERRERLKMLNKEKIAEERRQQALNKQASGKQSERSTMQQKLQQTSAESAKLKKQLDAYKAQNDAQQAALTNLKKRQVQLQQELRSANAGKGMDEEAKQVEAERLKREIERLASDTAALSAL